MSVASDADQPASVLVKVLCRHVCGCLNGVLDAGLGRSFVGFQIEVALAALTTFTFKGYAGGDELAATPADTALDTINKENSDGSAAAPYTVEVAAGTGYFPLDAAVFNGCRFIQVLSDVDNDTKVAEFVSKPV